MDVSSNSTYNSQQQNNSQAPGRATNMVKRKTYDDRSKGLEDAAKTRPATGTSNVGAN